MRKLTVFHVLVGLALASTPVSLAYPALADDGGGDSGSQGNNSGTDAQGFLPFTPDKDTMPGPTEDPYGMHDSGGPSPGAIETINTGNGQTRV